MQMYQVCADYPYYSCLFVFIALPSLLHFSILSNYFIVFVVHNIKHRLKNGWSWFIHYDRLLSGIVTREVSRMED